MFFTELFFRFYRYLTFKGIRNYDNQEPDVTEWNKFIYSIPEPKDDIERSYCRYLCRMYYFSSSYKFLANIAAFFALFLSIPVYFRKSVNTNNAQNKGVLLVRVSEIKELDVEYNDIIPEDILENYGELKEVYKPKNSNRFLDDHSKIIFKASIKRRPFAFHLNYLIFRELCMYSYLTEVYKPKAIAVYVEERNIVVPIISLMCEQKGVEFVSFMHGEYILQLIQGFLRFTKYYVWDEHYIKMFTEDLRCAPNQFIIYRPKKYQGLCKLRESEISYEYFATYYFGDESKKRIQRVADIFCKLRDQGKVCKVRPHPRQTTTKDILDAFESFYIEDPYKVSLAQSIECSRFIIALNSTVLSEAYYSGKEIVIDDYSEYERYKNLLNRKFIMLYKPHKLFSELLTIQ